MLALTYALINDECYRTDLQQTFKLAAIPASVLTNWIPVIAGDGNQRILGGVAEIESLPTISHGVVIQRATYDAMNVASAINSQFLWTVPPNDEGFFRVLLCAKVTQVASSSSTLGGSGGFTVNFTSADDGQVLNSLPGVLNGNVGHNDLTTTWGFGDIIIYAEVNTNISFNFGYLSSGATPMQYAIHVRLEDL